MSLPSHKVPGLSVHRYLPRGPRGEVRAQTVCSSAVLGWFGIGHNRYKYSGYIPQIVAILRRFRWSVRNVTRAIHQATGSSKPTMTHTKEALANRSIDPPGTVYVVHVRRHVLLVGGDGQVLVDTSPRPRVDNRRMLEVYAVYQREPHE